MISPETLRRYPFFGAFDDAQLRQLAQISEVIELPKGTMLFNINDQADTFMLLMKGGVELNHIVQEEMRPEKRKEYAVGDVNPDEVLGFSSVIKPYRYTASARVTSPVANLIRLDAVKLRTWMEKDPAFGMLWMHQTSQQLLLRLNIVRVQLAAAWA